MLDPIKTTIVTPGLDLNGDFAETGIPASIVSKYLAEHGVVVEKTGLYSFFIMFTIGITKGRWNTLLTAMQQFKDDYDRNQPLARILPEFVQQHRRYERMGLKDLCQHVHEMYAKYDIARLTTEMYLGNLTPAMKPADAYAHIAQRKTERVEIDQLAGRITVGLITPYPPGIPLLIPGEVFSQKIVDYLLFAREFSKLCPGFETDIHGLVEVEDEHGEVRFYADCVAQWKHLLQSLAPRPKKPKPARPNKALWPWPLTTRPVAGAKLIAAYGLHNKRKLYFLCLFFLGRARLALCFCAHFGHHLGGVFGRGFGLGLADGQGGLHRLFLFLAAANLAFFAADQAANVFAVAPHQQGRHHHDGHQQRCFDRPQAAIQNQIRHRCAQAGQERGHGGIARDKRHHQPNAQHDQAQPATNAQQHTQGGGHAFAAFEAKKHREQVPHKRAQRHQGQRPIAQAPLRAPGFDHQHGNQAL